MLSRTLSKIFVARDLNCGSCWQIGLGSPSGSPSGSPNARDSDCRSATAARNRDPSEPIAGWMARSVPANATEAAFVSAVAIALATGAASVSAVATATAIVRETLVKESATSLWQAVPRRWASP